MREWVGLGSSDLFRHTTSRGNVQVPLAQTTRSVVMEKSLDIKLARILKDRSCEDFILADAKDGDMAYGLSAPGLSPENYSSEYRFKTLDEYRAQIREVIKQGLVDIVLMSASTNEQLTLRVGLFQNSPLTPPAIRANDASDIWLAGAGTVYGDVPSRPFRTATLDHVQQRSRPRLRSVNRV